MHGMGSVANIEKAPEGVKDIRVHVHYTSGEEHRYWPNSTHKLLVTSLDTLFGDFIDPQLHIAYMQVAGHRASCITILPPCATPLVCQCS